GGDRKEPRTETAFDIKLISRLVDLKEGFLEDVFRRGAVAQEADEKMVQFPLVPLDQAVKAATIAIAVVREQLLVRALIRRLGGGIRCTRGTGRNSTVPAVGI